ncbi:MAG TPA: class I SAM-dependent methyltransferase [Rhabdochlamydiaceae bacterium]
MVKNSKVLWVILICLFSVLHAQPSIDEVKEEVRRGLFQITGWCSQEKAMNFIDLVLEVKPQVCVEIGVFGGRSVFPVAMALKFLESGFIIGIDPWDRIECLKHLDTVEDPKHFDHWGKEDLKFAYRSYLEMIKKYDLEEYCVTKKISSEKAVPSIDFIDILYIDGNHSEASSLQDVALYLPKVRSGGYIWFNDPKWPSLYAACNFLQKNCEVIKMIDNDNCILFRKR